MKDIKMKFSLITGASEGIGKAFAMECAANGQNIILVARNEEKLKALTSEIRTKYKVQAIYLPLDLTDTDAPAKLLHFCEENKYIVNLLINNAGFGYTNKFLNLEVEFYEKMVLLNNMGHLKVIRLFAEKMVNLSKANIINISSIAGLHPMPYKSVYSATKHFMTNLSLSLSYEFKDTNLHISVVCPGGVPTNEAVIKRMQNYGAIKRASFTSPAQVAKEALTKSYKGKILIIPGFLNRLTYYLVRVLPTNLKMKIIQNTISEEIAHL